MLLGKIRKIATRGDERPRWRWWLPWWWLVKWWHKKRLTKTRSKTTTNYTIKKITKFGKGNNLSQRQVVKTGQPLSSILLARPENSASWQYVRMILKFVFEIDFSSRFGLVLFGGLRPCHKLAFSWHRTLAYYKLVASLQYLLTSPQWSVSCKSSFFVA